ncbi:hypothetical protein [Pseudomonas alkylphenolica]|uniref:hypothetical protein n=1 Tax=Pseudomonas alkylphenolica TaxID=237609 RepID=UPI000F91EE03
MKLPVLLVLSLSVMACTNTIDQRRQSADTPGDIVITASQLQALNMRGESMQENVTKWFNDNSVNCGTTARPAFLCGGLMVRATQSYQSFLPWEPSPGSVERQGVSFSWYRADTPVRGLFNSGNGFLFYPVLETPPGKNSDIQVKCVFPRDGATDQRMPACGMNPKYPASKPCNEQGINTAEQWIKHYDDLDAKGTICGWNVSEGQPNSAGRFNESIHARKKLPESELWNELILQPWDSASNANLPIAAFFYTRSNADAEARAKDDQRRYYETFNQLIPLVSIAFGGNNRLEVRYEAHNQGVRL